MRKTPIMKEAERIWNNGQPVPERHRPSDDEEDRRYRDEGGTDARSRIHAFMEHHQAEFACLVLFYADIDAEQLLEELRERFWARLEDDGPKEAERHE
jgi:hypothetical protein